MAATPPLDETDEILDRLLIRYREEPVDLLGLGHAEGEYRYLASHREGYARTLRHLLEHFRAADRKDVRILEIGCFLGIVSIALARLGFRVTALDIPEFLACPRLCARLNESGVEALACNLKDYSLPFPEGAYDAVVMCETLEHLNFNPLPVVREINRVLKPGGLFYLALPNIASAANRARLLRGESIHNPVRDFFAQLDPEKNMIVGLHWREYTRDEIREMLEGMDFSILRQTFHAEHPSGGAGGVFRRMVKRAVVRLLRWGPLRRLVFGCLLDEQADPALSPLHVTLARKERPCERALFLTEANR
ncbi:MAG: class I SAM-dependent methyltransferase [Planctomycetota bacterium]